MLLQLANKHESIFNFYWQREEVHPEHLYFYMMQLLAEVATYTRDTRRWPMEASYQHDNLSVCLLPLMDGLRQSLSMVLEQHAIAITLIAQNYGVHVGHLNDKELLSHASFVLAIHADMSPDEIKQQLPKQIKISSVEQIKDLVSRGLPGVGITPLTVAPRQIPYHANFAYFQVEKNNETWSQIEATGALALHVGGQFPNLRMELWAIRG